MAYGNVQVLASGATVIVPAGKAAAAGNAGLIYNGGANTIYVGDDSSVATTTGIPVASGQSYTFTSVNKGLWGIAASADQVSPADTRWNTEQPRSTHY